MTNDEQIKQINAALEWIALGKPTDLSQWATDITAGLQALADDYTSLVKDQAENLAINRELVSEVERLKLGLAEAQQTAIERGNELLAARNENAELNAQVADLAPLKDENGRLKVQLRDAEGENAHAGRQVNEALRILTAHYQPEKPFTLVQLPSAVQLLVSEKRKADGLPEV